MWLLQLVFVMYCRWIPWIARCEVMLTKLSIIYLVNVRWRLMSGGMFPTGVKCPLSFFLYLWGILSLHQNVLIDCQTKRNVIQGILITTCWCTWMARNDLVFKNIAMIANKIRVNVNSLSYLWIKIGRPSLEEFVWF